MDAEEVSVPGLPGLYTILPQCSAVISKCQHGKDYGYEHLFIQHIVVGETFVFYQLFI